MRRRDLIVRAAGVVLTGELVVHQLRYLIVPASQDAHGYLPLLGVASVVALAAGAGHLAATLERARRTGRDERVALGFLRAWGMVVAGVLALFWAQETFEALLLGAALAAPLAPLTGGGWVALPLALALGAVLALALTGARAAVRAAAQRARAGVERVRPRRRRLPEAALLVSF
ncbi:MAG TPA: hypothetical protein VFY44_04200, partial [Thermoleophilaceae bacterium]|nr:hypothetical protein [Thermoleophilaceae bacterium]